MGFDVSKPAEENVTTKVEPINNQLVEQELKNPDSIDNNKDHSKFIIRKDGRTQLGSPIPRYIQRNIMIPGIRQNMKKEHLNEMENKKVLETDGDKGLFEKQEDIFHVQGGMFFQKSCVQSEMISSEDSQKQQVELFFTFIPKLKYQKTYLCINPLISKKKDSVFDNLGFSNMKFGKTITFDTSFVIDYFFESHQDVEIKLFDTSNKKQKLLLHTFKTSVGEILGSKGQKIIISDKSVGELTISGNPYNKSEDLCLDFQITLIYPRDNISPFYLIKRNVSQDKKSFSWINSYKSEVNFKYKEDKTFKKNSLKIQMLNGDCSLTKPFMIEFYDYSTKTSIGYLIATVAELSDENYIGKLRGLNGIEDPNSKIRLKCEVVEEYKFLDYLRGGLQLSMIFGIDYTASNGEPDKVDSLHYIKSNAYNDYQRAIRSCGDIVAFYDYDQLFPVFGYGAILEKTNETSFCFNCNFKDDPNVNTIDGVLEVYKSSLSKVKLYGPTYFSPIIKKAISIAKNILEKKDYIYSILIILTDGKINDMKQTIDCIVKASYLPISIIIIGIGNADFNEMITLDSDDVELLDSKGQKAVRDIVQFVPMNIFQNDGTLLAEKVLEEIPKQIIEYFKLIGEPPREPNLIYI